MKLRLLVSSLVVLLSFALSAQKSANVYLINADIEGKEMLKNSFSSNNSSVVIELEVTDNTSTLLTKIASAVEGQRINSINILSHGEAGLFYIGNDVVSNESGQAVISNLYKLNFLLDQDAFFNIYSCESGMGEKGAALFSKLKEWFNFNVSLSNNITGFGGDWELEIYEKPLEGVFIESSILEVYPYRLQTVLDPLYTINVAFTGTGNVTEMTADIDGGRLFWHIDNSGLSPTTLRVGDLSNLTHAAVPGVWSTTWHPFVATDIEYFNDSIFTWSNSVLSMRDLSASGAVTLPSAPATSGNECGMARIGDVLYFQGSNRLWSKNLISGVVTNLMPMSDLSGLEYCSNTGKMYFCTYATNQLFEVNLSTLSYNLIANLPGGHYSNFAVDENGQFAYIHYGSVVKRVSLTTGAVSDYVIGIPGAQPYFDVRFAPKSGTLVGESLYIGGAGVIYEVFLACTGPSFLTCPSDITVNNVPNNCGRVVNYTLPTYDAGDCGGTAMTQIDGTGYTAGDLFPVGTTTQTYQIMDGLGNSATCTFNVIVNDVEAPVITPLTFSNITANNNAGQCGANVSWLEPTASDNCPGVTLTASNTMGSFFPVGTTTVTYTATDASSNTASLSFDVTVIDAEAPAITSCPAPQTLSADPGMCSTTTTLGTPTFTDNCAVVSTTNDAPAIFPVGVTTVTWTVMDAAGNSTICTQDITVTDDEAPIAICQNISVDLDATGNVTVTASAVDNLSSDNCGIASLSLSQSDFDCSHVGSNTVTLTVLDNNGNSSTCASTVTINDITVPAAICQDVTVQLDVTGNVMLNTNQVDNLSSDACGIASMSLSQSTYTCAEVGVNPVTLTVVDVNGNSNTCSANITVEDNVAPTIACHDLTVQLDVAGTASIVPADVTASATDVCGIVSSTLDVSSFTCTNVGTPVTVNLLVTDMNGNSSTCPAVVTVEDNIAPIALCQNFSVDLDALGNATINASDIDGGSNDACGFTLMASKTIFSCNEVGPNNITLTVTDPSGNASTCVAIVTVNDVTAPTAVCQNITVQLDASGNATITGNDVDNGSSDACGIATLSVSPSTFTCTNIGSNAVILTVTDNNGNVSTCNATVTVQDNVAPTAVCQNITVYLDGTGNVTILDADIDGGSSDACGIASVVASQTTFNCSNIGTNNVTLTITDNNGNTSSCTAIVTVLENTAPIAVCQDLTLNLDALGNVTIVASDLDNGSTDNCGVVNFSASQTSFDCSDLGTNSVVLTVTDNSGNSSTCTSNVTIVDNIAPTAICQNITVNLNAAGTVSITPSMLNNGSTDNCSITSVTASQTTFTCANVGANNVTLTVTDQSGNSSTCTAVVTVVDNIAPTAICQNISVNLDATGNATASASMVNNGSFDNCGIASMTLSQTAFTCANVGPNPVVLTVTDVNGLVSTCNATVTVLDAMTPTVVCQNITVNLNAAGTATITAAMIDGGSTDNCGIASMSASMTSFNCSNVGANNVLLTVNDVNGNSATCTAVVTVVDAVAPIANCQNISVNLNAAGIASITGAMINNGSTDACGIASLVASPSTFTCAELGANTVTLTVTDVNGNTSTCTSTVTVVDNTAPTAICQNVLVNLDATGNATVTAAMVNNGSTDNCGIASMTLSQTTFTCANVGGNPVTLTVTDVNGNVSTCSAVVTVVDNLAPIAICQNATVNLDAAGNATVTSLMINNGSSDNCGIASMSVSPNTFNCSNVGPNNVTLTVTDVNGNVSTCISTVTVVDAMAPNAICQNLTVNLDATGNVSITPSQINNGSNDNCGIGSMTLDVSSFDCSNVGPNSVTLTVTDVNGNVSTCTSTVTVVDAIVPNAICQNITVPLDATGNASITAIMIDNGSNDNCSIASINASPTTFTCANVGANNVTLTVVDVNGNVSTCNSIVTIIDNTAPTAVCQNQTLNLDIFGQASTTIGMLESGSSDACGIASISASQLTFDCTDLGVNNITISVTDVNGNVGTCTSVVTIQDQIAPVLTTQDITVPLDATGNATITGSMITAAAFDNCGITSSIVSPSTFDCSNIGANTVTLTSSDASGNTATGTAIVTIVDNLAPVAICQNVTISLDATGNATITPAMIDNGSTDNCGVASVTASQTSFTCANIGNNNVILTVTDVNGNSSTCLAVVTVNDIITPTALCQNATINLDSNGDALLTPAMVNNASTDNCSIAYMGLSQSVFDCSNIGANVVNLTITDNSGNSSTCNSTVTVFDGIAPNAICQNTSISLDASGNAMITSAMIDNLSNDNCSIASFSASQTTFDCSNIGSNNVILTVTDPSGNSSTCTAIVTVIDNLAPIVTCQAMTVNLDASGNATITAAMIDNASTDNCGIASMSVSPNTFNCANVGPNNVTLTVTDVNGNVSTCTSIVTIVDVIAPNALCQNISTYLNPSGNASITTGMLNNASTDECGITSISASQLVFDCSNLGANNITLTVTDVNGNSNTCTSIVTVIDNIYPVITCPAAVTVNATTGMCGAAVTLANPTSSDNCSTVISNNAPTVFPVGTTTVTWTATDPAGNAVSCTQMVTVLDTQAPTITCPAAISVNTDPNICFATGVVLGSPTTADNCSVASVTNNAPSVYPTGTTVVTWTATDLAGNTSTCTQNVTVVDNQAPVINCPADITLTSTQGSCGRVVTYATPQVIDNCMVMSMTQSDNSGYTSGNVFPVGTTVISYTAVDGGGNTYTCSFNVTITDDQEPILSNCPSDIIVQSDNDCDVAVNWIAPTAMDNCPGVQLTTTNAPGSEFGPGTTIVTYTATDNSGNTTVCSFNVTVIDGNSPVVPVLADVYNSCEVTSLPSPVANDVCQGEITGTTNIVFPITTVGVTPVVWSFNDGQGNISTATQYVYIDGDVDATVSPVNEITLMANNNNATSYQWIDCATGNSIPGATAQTYTATQNGSYAVIVTEGNCPATTSTCYDIKNVSLDDITFEDLVIYPNPSLGGEFTIKYEGKIDKVEIVDMIGRIISVETKLIDGKVSGNALATGKYFVNIYSEGKVIVKELIVVSK